VGTFIASRRTIEVSALAGEVLIPAATTVAVEKGVIADVAMVVVGSISGLESKSASSLGVVLNLRATFLF
jgi:hypothetical protein